MSNQSADAAFDALGEPVRRRILELLREGPTPVGRLAERLPVGLPAVSKHLRVLSNAGLIEHRSAGTRNLYALAPDGMAAAQQWLVRTWDTALAAYAPEVSRGSANHPRRNRGATHEQRPADPQGDPRRRGPGPRVRRIYRRHRSVVAAGREERARQGCHGGLRRRQAHRAFRGRGGRRLGYRHPLGTAGGGSVHLASRPVRRADQPRHGHLRRGRRADAGPAGARRLGGLRRPGRGPGRIRPGLAAGARLLPGVRLGRPWRRDLGGAPAPPRPGRTPHRVPVRGPAVRPARRVPEPDARGRLPGPGGSARRRGLARA